MGVALNCACDPLLQADHWFVAQVLFGPLAAVVVEGSGQSHSHGCECWFEGNKRTQEHAQQPEEKGQSINQAVREVKARRRVSQTHQHLRHEVPKGNWLIIGDVIRLQGESQNKRSSSSREKKNHTFFFLTHLPTDGRVWSQMLSSQDVSMNDILHICEIYQIGPIAAEHTVKFKERLYQKKTGMICRWIDLLKKREKKKEFSI